MRRAHGPRAAHLGAERAGSAAIWSRTNKSHADPGATEERSLAYKDELGTFQAQHAEADRIVGVRGRAQ